MISRFLLVPSFTMNGVFKSLQNFFNNTQIFHQLFSIFYSGKLGLRYCAGFLQIQSHMIRKLNSQKHIMYFCVYWQYYVVGITWLMH